MCLLVQCSFIFCHWKDKVGMCFWSRQGLNLNKTFCGENRGLSHVFQGTPPILTDKCSKHNEWNYSLGCLHQPVNDVSSLQWMISRTQHKQQSHICYIWVITLTLACLGGTYIHKFRVQWIIPAQTSHLFSWKIVGAWSGLNHVKKEHAKQSAGLDWADSEWPSMVDNSKKTTWISDGLTYC